MKVTSGAWKVISVIYQGLCVKKDLTLYVVWEEIWKLLQLPLNAIFSHLPCSLVFLPIIIPQLFLSASLICVRTESIDTEPEDNLVSLFFSSLYFGNGSWVPLLPRVAFLFTEKLTPYIFSVTGAWSEWSHLSKWHPVALWLTGVSVILVLYRSNRDLILSQCLKPLSCHFFKPCFYLWCCPQTYPLLKEIYAFIEAFDKRICKVH